MVLYDYDVKGKTTKRMDDTINLCIIIAIDKTFLGKNRTYYWVDTQKRVSQMPWYRSVLNPLVMNDKGELVHGKIQRPLTDQEFKEAIEHGEFKKERHKAYCVLLFYSGTRKGEAARAVKEQFTLAETSIIWEVGPRFKKAKYLKTCPNCQDRNSTKALFCKKCAEDLSQVEPTLVRTKTVTTPPLEFPLKAPFMELLKKAVEQTAQGQRVFPYSPMTCYYIVHRAGLFYPHLSRLTRITTFYEKGFKNPDLKGWTGLSLAALDFYAALAETREMGKSLAGGEHTK